MVLLLSLLLLPGITEDEASSSARLLDTLSSRLVVNDSEQASNVLESTVKTLEVLSYRRNKESWVRYRQQLCLCVCLCLCV